MADLLVACVTVCSICVFTSSVFSVGRPYLYASTFFTSSIPLIRRPVGENNKKLIIINSIDCNVMVTFHSLCSVSSPYNLILLASCCAFFFNRHARDANLFFSLRNFGLSLNGDSFTDVIWLMVRPNLSNSLPMQCNFRGFGVKSFPSPLRALPLCCNLTKKSFNFHF